MKIVLTNPPWTTAKKIGFRSNVRWPFMVSRREHKMHKGAVYHFPIYHAYAAAMLQEQGKEVDILDASLEGLSTKQFIESLSAKNPDLVIMEVSTPSYSQDVVTAREVREKISVPVVFIGSHASVFHREIIERKEANIVIRGEFEETIGDLVRHIEQNRDLKEVKGITFLDNKGSIVTTENRPYIEELDSLPYPARDLFQWQRYHEPVFESLPWITMLSSRGCPYQCVFCSWPQTMYGRQYRTRKPEGVLKEMIFCQEKYHPGEFYFDDDTFTIDKKRIQSLCHLLIETRMNVPWSCMGRIDTLDEETLILMAKAGCRRMKLGIETGSPQIMKTIKKRLRLETIPEVVEIAQSLGIKIHGTFMIGLPGDTWQTVQETIGFALKLKLDTAQFSIATPFPGTEFFAMSQDKGWLVTTDWSCYDGAGGSVVAYPQLSKKEIDMLLSIAWTSLYANQRDFVSLSKKAFNKIRDEGLRESFRVMCHYFMKGKREGT